MSLLLKATFCFNKSWIGGFTFFKERLHQFDHLSVNIRGSTALLCLRCVQICLTRQLLVFRYFYFFIIEHVVQPHHPVHVLQQHEGELRHGAVCAPLNYLKCVASLYVPNINVIQRRQKYVDGWISDCRVLSHLFSLNIWKDLLAPKGFA